MRGTAIQRALRQLTMLPLRHETIFHLVFDPNGTTPGVVNRLIASDPALALAVLRLAPRSIREGYVSVAQIARFATPATLFEMVRSAPAPAAEKADEPQAAIRQIWLHSVAVAHAARHLSRRHKYEHVQTAFLAGLLHNVGLLGLATVATKEVNELLVIAEPPNDWHDAEQARLGTTHTSAGNQLAKRWGLPQWLHEVAWWHHQTDKTLPRSVEHRQLVELVRDADQLVSSGSFALGRMLGDDAWELPWKNADAVAAAVTRGVRQTVTFLRDHPATGAAVRQEELVARAAELARENVALRSEFDWRRHAWDRLVELPPDASPVEMTGVVSEAFAQALGALGALCYVRSEDGSSAEGSFWCDNSRPIHVLLEVGAREKPHADQVVAKLRPTWQQRPFQVFDLSVGEASVAHVLVWLDEFGPATSDETLREVTALCTHWLTQAVHVAELEAQLESLTAALRDQAAQSDARLEDAKLAALAEMAAGAGHEINNPLAVISGRAQLMLAEETDPRRRKSLETIMAQAQRIHCMIVDLMMFARPPVPDTKPTSIGDVIDRAVTKLKAEADELKVTLSVAAGAELPQVSCDATQLTMAVECILRNAIEASPPGGAVAVHAEPASGKLALQITDSGGGISDEQLQHIFEPFYSGRDAGRGLGMGLSKAWRIVQNHCGEINVESGTGGTTVTVTLPALAAAAVDRVCA